MINLGQLNTLSIIGTNANGTYLDGGEQGEILLPNTEVPANSNIGDAIEVFIFHDSASRIVATTKTPTALANTFASLQVKQVNKMGAFLDWGLPKELLVPYNLQHTKMEMGKHYLVYVFVDARSEKLVASSKLDKFLDIWPAEYEGGEKVDIIIGGKTDLGFKAIINDKHWGLLYQNEIFKPLRVGKKMTAYIKQVREDGRIDLSLSRAGKGKVIDFKDDLLAYLEKHQGFCPLNDKSSPELISSTFGVSKKTYKATIGNLLKQKKVRIESDGVYLN